MEQKIGKKIFHICMVIVIIVAILFGVGVIVLRYQVEGETNLPFELSKIRIISSTDAEDLNDDENRWDLGVSQNNDVYLYITKNSNYEKTEVISEVVLNNFSVDDAVVGSRNIYKPAIDENIIFKNIEDNKVNELTYEGDLESNMKLLKISNQGGMIAFRLANDSIATYVSNDADEINYANLLKDTQTNIDDIKCTLNFDIYINLISGKKYKATVSLDLPVDDVVNLGTSSQEITDMSNIIFKRVEGN